MTDISQKTISINASYNLDAQPDVALVKIHFVGEGMTMEDAAANVRRKVSEATETLMTTCEFIKSITAYDVYFGQKEERLGAESQSFPRPLVVQGLLITAPPDDPNQLYRMIDEGIKRGAVLGFPHRRSYMSDTLDSSLLFGLVDSEKYEQEAIERCLKYAERRCRETASIAQKALGQLRGISGVTVEPSMPKPFREDSVHIRRTFPTRFLSPTPQKVVLSASLVATYEIKDR